jgi:hypothetical protein
LIVGAHHNTNTPFCILQHKYQERWYDSYKRLLLIMVYMIASSLSQHAVLVTKYCEHLSGNVCSNEAMWLASYVWVCVASSYGARVEGSLNSLTMRGG